MKTTTSPVSLRSTHDELLALFEAAERGAVDTGGRYDQRGAAITVWSHPWTHDATRHDSETIGTWYVKWGDENCIDQTVCDAGFDLADLLHELAVLEDTALGSLTHGVTRCSRPRLVPQSQHWGSWSHALYQSNPEKMGASRARKRRGRWR